MHAEFGNDTSGMAGALLDQVSVPGAHGSWRRAVLLALHASERAEDALNRRSPALAADNAEPLCRSRPCGYYRRFPGGCATRLALGGETEQAYRRLCRTTRPGAGQPDCLVFIIGDRLPDAAVPQFVDLYRRWTGTFAGQDALSPQLAARAVCTWLVQVEV